jgi:hypothetical protein
LVALQCSRTFHTTSDWRQVDLLVFDGDCCAQI